MASANSLQLAFDDSPHYKEAKGKRYEKGRGVKAYLHKETAVGGLER